MEATDAFVCPWVVEGKSIRVHLSPSVLTYGIYFPYGTYTQLTFD